MNKAELIDKITEAIGINKVAAKKTSDATTNSIKEALKEGDKVQLIGFGTSSVSRRSAREEVNLLTKGKIQIAAKKVAKFKAGAELADALDQFL